MEKFLLYIPAGSSGLSGQDELMKITGVENKAMIEIDGKKIVEYVIEAADKAERISEIILVGLTPEDLDGIYETKIHFVPSFGSRIDTLKNMVQYLDNQGFELKDFIVSLSADVPLITSKIIDRSIGEIMKKQSASDIEYDLFYPLIDTKVLEAKYPQATKRSRKFREGKFYTGDLMMFRPYMLQDEETMNAVEKIMGSRKTMARLLMKFDFFAPIKYMLGWLSLENDIFKFLHEYLNVRITYILSEDPEQFIDLDYVEDFEFIKQITSR